MRRLHPPGGVERSHARVFTLATSIALVAALSACLASSEPAAHEFSGQTMGTTYRVLIDDPLTEAGATAVHEAVTASLAEVNRLMSTWDPDSEISRFNRSRETGPFEVSPHTLRVLAVSIDIAERSGGAFDPTVGPVVAAWGFGPEGPTPDRTGAAASGDGVAGRTDAPGFTRLAIDTLAMTLSKLDPQVEVDLSGVAKGYAVDWVAAALSGLGLSRFMIEIGGELRARGTKRDGQPWRAGIEAPVVGRREVYLTLDLLDRALATSGDYRNFREEGGQRVGHLIDPRTGRPVRWRSASVSVLHRTATVADAWATALSVLTPETGHALAEAEGLAALFLVHDDDGTRARATAAFRARAGGALAEGVGADESR